MTTLRTVEEVAKDFGNDTQIQGDVCSRVTDIKRVLTQDRQHILAVLREGVEKKRLPEVTSDRDEVDKWREIKLTMEKLQSASVGEASVYIRRKLAYAEKMLNRYHSELDQDKK